MANVDNPNGFTFEYSMAGMGSERLVKGTLAASNTVAKGDALIESGVTAGQLAIAASNSGLLMGVAAEAATVGAGATTDLYFYPAVPWYVFSGQCSGTYATTIRYSAVDIEGTTGIMEVNEDATTELVIYIIGELDGSEIGANTRVLFTIVRSSFLALEDAE